MKLLKTRMILIVFLLTTAESLNAQMITEGEYFFNTDPGLGNGIPVTLNQNEDEYIFSGNLNTSSLSRGIHVLFIRTKNEEGEWGLPVQHMIYVNAETGSETGSMEYFYGEDPGQGKGNPLSVNRGEAIVLQAGISTTGLSPGVHQLSIRAGNGEGSWGMPIEHLVYVSRTDTDGTAVLTMAEYFTESDPGFSEAISLTLNGTGEEYTAEFSIPGAGFAIGEQQLYVRVGDENGVWGLYAPTSFLNTEVPALFFENTDTLQYEINSGLLFFAENLTVSSETDVSADSAQIQLTDGFIPEQDSLGVEDTGSLEINRGPGWIKLRGNDDLDEYRDVLQTVYLTTIEAESYSDTLKRFEIKIWNGAFASDSVVRYVSVSHTDSTTTTSTEETDAIPDFYSLSPNYPNPFNPTTQIRYGIPEMAEVSLTVYNMLGQQVASLVRARQQAGWYTVSFDASGLASGAYLYRLEAGEFISTKKLMLIK